MILPWASSTAANSVVMPSRLSSCVRVLSRTRNNGTLLRVRSKTWFWLFSSHHKTNACSGGSRDCAAKFDPFLDEPFETLKAFGLMRFQTSAVSGTRDRILAPPPPTAHRPPPTAFARLRVDRRAADRVQSLPAAVRTIGLATRVATGCRVHGVSVTPSSSDNTKTFVIRMARIPRG